MIDPESGEAQLAKNHDVTQTGSDPSATDPDAAEALSQRPSGSRRHQGAFTLAETIGGWTSTLANSNNDATP